MMRRVMLLVLLLVASVAAALWFEQQGGFVMVRLGELTLQTSLFVAVVVLVVGFALLWLLAGLLQRLWQTPGALRARWSEHRSHKAQRELIDGLIELAEGRFARAERQLESTSAAAEQPLLHHLLAALAAQRQGNWQRRDDLLALADTEAPRARVAIGLVQAQLQVEAEQWEQALATLGWLREKAPNNDRVVDLLVTALQAVEDDAALRDLLPVFRAQSSLSTERLAAIEYRALEQAFAELGPDAGSDALADIWKSLPKARQRDPALQALYARALMTADCPATAERELKRWLRRHWSPELVAVYGDLETDPKERALEQLTQWLNERPEDPALLFAAGRQAMRCSLWGQARDYLQAAAARDNRAEILRLLAELHEQLGETEKARQCYRRALGLDTD